MPEEISVYCASLWCVTIVFSRTFSSVFGKSSDRDWNAEVFEPRVSSTWQDSYGKPHQRISSMTVFPPGVVYRRNPIKTAFGYCDPWASQNLQATQC